MTQAHKHTKSLKWIARDNQRAAATAASGSAPGSAAVGAPGGSETVMQKALGKLHDRRQRLVRQFQRRSGLADHAERASSSGPARRGLSKGATAAAAVPLNWIDDMEYSERQNSVRTLDLFKYARAREILAIAAGIASMVYAASWQPISVFILAIMASLMGQYSKQTSWLKQLNSTASSGERPGELINETATAVVATFGGGGPGDRFHLTGAATLGPDGQLQLGHLNDTLAVQHENNYADYSFLGALHSFVTPLFELSLAGGGGGGGSSGAIEATGPQTTGGAVDAKPASGAGLQAALREMYERESEQFLRKSFEINASAFVLALTQLAAFFLGLSLLTWAARKQASRIKLLYFRSCLYQEITWFEAIDSASGSGSSLNGLVDRYEDGVGMKLALLCYFLGHVGLFALTAFYQMFSLAAFCMPFVLVIGLIIARLSEHQAAAIGKQALFAKRSLQLAEEIIAAIRTVFAFNGQQKEIARYSLSLEPVYRKSLMKHLYTALNTALSKFSIFACFAAYCFYAKHLFPPHSTHANSANKATILAVMRGAEVSIVNILISIPFMEALQQSKGSIARIFAAIERRSRISAACERGLKFSGPPPAELPTPPEKQQQQRRRRQSDKDALAAARKQQQQQAGWTPSISFRMVQFGYADRAGPTARRRSTLPSLSLAPGDLEGRARHASAEVARAHRRRSVIEQMADEALDSARAGDPEPSGVQPGTHEAPAQRRPFTVRRQSTVIRHMLGNEIRQRKLARANGAGLVLRDFNLDIEAGQSVALVGPSGSGKSTLLALVQRLYDTTGGQLLVGRHDIKELNLAWLRNQIGLVGQEPRLFDMSIAENIALGLSQEQFEALVGAGAGAGEADLADALAAVTVGAGGGDLAPNRDKQQQQLATRRELLMQQVVEAARAANAHEFIERLPRGYATRVGSGGFQLSGGQKQRIAIARALIRKPKILLLDECTSALDTESEALVHAALKASSATSSAAPGDRRTTLIVAHRLETIRHVDLIVVMNQGQAVACGTHEELMRAARAPASDIHAGARIYRQLYEEQLRAAPQPQPQRPPATAATGGSGGSGGGDDGDDGDNDDGATLERADCDNKVARGPHSGGQNCGGATGGRTDQDLRAKGFAPAVPLRAGLTDDPRRRELRECNADHADYGDEDDDDDEISITNTSSSASSSSSGSGAQADKPSVWSLWRFIEMPKWSTLAAVLVCLLAGLILPLNLIAHSYLFSAFAYNELEQIGEYLHVFGLLILSFSTFVLIVSFLQVILPGYVGEKLSARLRVKTMRALLQKPMFYFDMDANSAGALCDRFNGHISNLQSIAGTRVATMLEACSTLIAGALFGFGQNLALSGFCLSFALLVLATTIIESRIVERESNLNQRHDGRLAHLMADALANIKTIAALNRERYFIAKFQAILRQRERGIGRPLVCLHTFLTSLKFVMPAMSWSASMFYGSYLLTSDRIELQTIYIVCPVVLFAVNDTFRALVFLPELLRARKSIERLFRLNREFSPEVLQTLTFGQQLAEQGRLHSEQLAAELGGLEGALSQFATGDDDGGGGGGGEVQLASKTCEPPARRPSNLLLVTGGHQQQAGEPALVLPKKKSISFALEPVDDEPQGPGQHTSEAREAEEPGQAAAAGSKRLSTQLNRRLSNLHNLPSYMRRKSSRLNSLVPRESARGSIEFKRVEFAYPNRPSALALDDFTLSLAPGESVALVGASGSGKSTTVAILEKFYDYHAGEVTLDGRDLRLVEPNWVRSQIGLVQQEPCLLSCTIGDNIRYGANGRFVTMDEVVEAARTANIHDFIMTLPDQYDTELSSSAYSSCQLSGGQRQRIAIARALVRNAPILIFDEATSALDNESEQVVQDALRKAKRGRTNLTIAHRLATIKDADKIVVMRDGRVVEQGRHEELLERPQGYYRALWAKQGVAAATAAAAVSATATQDD